MCSKVPLDGTLNVIKKCDYSRKKLENSWKSGTKVENSGTTVGQSGTKMGKSGTTVGKSGTKGGKSGNKVGKVGLKWKKVGQNLEKVGLKWEKVEINWEKRKKVKKVGQNGSTRSPQKCYRVFQLCSNITKLKNRIEIR